MKKPLILLTVLSVFVFVAYQKWLQVPFYHVQSYVFGTLIDISIVGEENTLAEQHANHILQGFQSLHERLHAWKPISENQPSELQLLNQAFSEHKSLHVAPDLSQMLANIEVLSKQSDGLFNPAIGQLIHMWGFQRDAFSPVTIQPERIVALVKLHPSMADIQIKDNVVKSENPAVALDFGGYAKGYALDLAVHYLKSQHVKNALINIGGNVVAIGENQGRPWRVGIQHPRKPEALATIDLLDGWAIGTSGDYQRYFELNGQRYCHLINPNTGYPVQHTQAVTVLVPPLAEGTTQAGVLSDVASKPIFIAPLADKANIAQKMGIDHYLIIDQAGQIYVSNALLKRLNWMTPDVKFDTL